MATTAIGIGSEPVAIEWQAQTVGVAPNIWKTNGVGVNGHLPTQMFANGVDSDE